MVYVELEDTKVRLVEAHSTGTGHERQMRILIGGMAGGGHDAVDDHQRQALRAGKPDYTQLQPPANCTRTLMSSNSRLGGGRRR